MPRISKKREKKMMKTEKSEMKTRETQNVKDEYLHLISDSADNKEAIERLAEIIRVLRAECPWDRVQTHESLRKGMIEEAYETVEAIDNADMANLREELGDVLLQVVFHANLAEESGNFDLKDVINEECEKMIRRHPHVFLKETGNNSPKSIDKVLEKWENIKVKEKHEETCTSRLQRVPRALPALMRAFKIQKKAADVGFDWDDVSGAFDKVDEERKELMEQYAKAPTSIQRMEEEMGDLLFSCVNAARFLGIDPENALNRTSEKFIRRFAYVESEAAAAGKNLESMTLSEMDKLWEEAKKSEHTVE